MSRDAAAARRRTPPRAARLRLDRIGMNTMRARRRAGK